MGCIYILTNRSFQGQIKVGYTDDLDALLQKLNNGISNPYPFEVYGTYSKGKSLTDREVMELLDIESDLLGSGFYNLQPESVFKKLKAIAKLSETEERLIGMSLPKPLSIVPVEENVYHTTRNGIKAFARYLGNNKMKVLAGSEVNLSNWGFDKNKGKDIKKIRKRLSKSGDFEPNGEFVILKIDVEFDSPSAASCFIFGSSSNGWTEWIADDGRTLDEVIRK